MVVSHPPAAGGPAVELNAHVRGRAPSPTLAINETCARLAAQGRDIYRLGLGQSPFPVPDFLQRSLQAHVARKAYLPVAGLPELRAAVAGFQQRVTGIAYTGDDILVGPGTKALLFLLQYVHAGTLVLANPSWVSYAPQAGIIGRPVEWLATDAAADFRVTPGALDALCRQVPGRSRLLVLNYPCNPTGVSYTREQLAALAAVARRHGVLILADEIYSGTHFEGAHASIAGFYPEGTIVSNGLSKWCGAGGWRLGAFAFPPALAPLREAMASVASETFSAVSAPIQHAAVPAFDDGPERAAYLEGSRRLLRALAGHMRATLQQAGADVPRPDGGFYLFVNVDAWRERLHAHGLYTSEQLCTRLLEDTGVAVLPGSAFGRPAGEMSLRLAYVDFDGAQALAALTPEATVDGAFLHRHCPAVVEAGRRMAAWLASMAR